MTTSISFELAKLLREKGFDKNTEANWWILAKDHSENYEKRLPVDESKVFFTKNSYELKLKTQIDEETEHNVFHVMVSPTIAEVVMWLYEKHGIWIGVFWDALNKKPFFASFGFVKKDKFKQTKFCHSPTEAYEAAIEYTLKNLIK